MINYDDVTKENIKYNNLNQPGIPNHPYITLIIRGSGSEKANVLLNLIKEQNDDGYSIISNVHLYLKD